MTVMLFENITSGQNDLSDVYWNDLSRVARIEGVKGPSGKRLDGHRIDVVDSLTPIMEQVIYNRDVLKYEVPVTFGAWLKKDSSSTFDSLRVSIRDSGAGNDNLILSLTTSLDDWQLLMGTHVFSTASVDSHFRFRIHTTPSGGSSGDIFYVSHPFCFVNCGSAIIDAELKSKFNSSKLEDIDRSDAGYESVYKWADILGYRLSSNHVPSREAGLINGWWGNNSELLFIVDSGADEIFHAKITNRSAPMTSYADIYTSAFEGVLDLESF